MTRERRPSDKAGAPNNQSTTATTSRRRVHRDPVARWLSTVERDAADVVDLSAIRVWLVTR